MYQKKHIYLFLCHCLLAIKKELERDNGRRPVMVGYFLMKNVKVLLYCVALLSGKVHGLIT